MKYRVRLRLNSVTIHPFSLNTSFKTLCDAKSFVRDWFDPAFKGYIIEIFRVKDNKIKFQRYV